MARVENIELKQRDRVQLHDPVDAGLYLFEKDGRKLIQIDTFGRDSREMPNKVSQSLQFDAKAAEQLFEYLGHHFGFKR
ncbi:methionyl-tRNA formyltransferase [Nitratireductor sp. CH_MIT9313-5]|uniref:methionyl-tRNA formyltransferase n=1 Tax=Nitratireductor sp. CH_MIT9313-5 TaxID=3107764 RepID=UPI00300A9B4A